MDCSRTWSATTCAATCWSIWWTSRQHAGIDRALYLPKSWTGDVERREQAAVPDEVGFTTKPQLAQQMIERAWTTWQKASPADPRHPSTHPRPDADAPTARKPLTRISGISPPSWSRGRRTGSRGPSGRAEPTARRWSGSCVSSFALRPRRLKSWPEKPDRGALLAFAGHSRSLPQ